MQIVPSDLPELNLTDDSDFAADQELPREPLPKSDDSHYMDSSTDSSADAIEKDGRSGTKLRTRLLQTLLPAVLLPLMLASFAGYRVIAQRSEARIQEQLKNQALLASEGTTAVLDDLLDLPRSIADSPLVINEARSGSREAEVAGLTDMSVEEIEAEFADTKLLRSHDALNTYLSQTVETAEIAEILVTDSHGFNVAYSRPVADMVQSDEAWWQNGKANQQWIGPPDFDFASKGFMVELAQAIYDPQNDNSFVGVIRTVLPTRKFSLLANTLQRTGITDSQRVQLVDGDKLSTIDTFSAQGFHKDRTIIGGEVVEQFISTFVSAIQAGAGVNIDTESAQLAQPPKGEEILAAIQSVRTQQSAIRDITLPVADEEIVVASFAYEDRQYKIANIASSNWVAISSMDNSEISAAGRDSLFFFSLITLLLGTIITGLIFGLSRQLSHPISRLTEQAKVAADGNLDIAVEPMGTAETRVLTQTFNQLIAQVKGLIESQSTETQKVQLFADITSAPITDRAEVSALLDRILPTARGILGVDRLAFFQVPHTDNPQDVNDWNNHEWRHYALQGQVASESVSSILPAVGSYSEGARWLPATTRRHSEQQPPTFVFSSRLDPAIDAEHRAFLEHSQVKSSLNMPVFYDISTPASDQPKRVLWGYLIAHSQSDRPWQSSDIRFLERLALQLKRVLDRIAAVASIETSYQAVRRSQQETEVVTRASQRQSESQRLHNEQLKQQVHALSEDISGVFQGDLTVRASVSHGDLKTVADVFNMTVAKLEELVDQVKGSTAEIDDFLSQNERSALQLARLTLQQSQDAVQTLEKIQAVAHSMDSVVTQAHDAAGSAHQVGDRAQAGKAAIDQAATKIQALSDISSDAISQIDHLSRASNNVSYMVEMTAGIAADMQKLASQTADSVAVWAARGEIEAAQQASLARTIQEMDKLAERSDSEAMLIDTFLNAVGKTAQQVTKAIERINQEVAHSNQTMQASQASLNEVLTAAEQYEQLARSVSEATQAQSHVSQTASELVATIVGLSEQTSQFSQEIARSLQNTATTAHELRSSVEFFKVKS